MGGKLSPGMLAHTLAIDLNAAAGPPYLRPHGWRPPPQAGPDPANRSARLVGGKAPHSARQGRDSVRRAARLATPSRPLVAKSPAISSEAKPKSWSQTAQPLGAPEKCAGSRLPLGVLGLFTKTPRPGPHPWPIGHLNGSARSFAQLLAASKIEGRRPHHHRAGTSSGLIKFCPRGSKAPTQQGNLGCRVIGNLANPDHPARCRPVALCASGCEGSQRTAARETNPPVRSKQPLHRIAEVTRHDPQTRPSAPSCPATPASPRPPASRASPLA